MSRRAKNRLGIAGLVVLALVTLGVVGWALKPVPAVVPSAAATMPSMNGLKPVFVPNLLVIGDSYTGGSDMGGSKENGWPALVQKSIGDTGQRLQLNMLDRGGAGYVRKGQIKENFVESYAGNAYRNQDVAVVFGSINDSTEDPAAVGAAARSLYTAIKKNSPNVALIVVGPAWPGPVTPANMKAVTAEVKAAAVENGASFIDADEWFRGDAHAMIGTDGTHPNNQGHVYMKDKLLPPIKAAVDAAVAAQK